ncbi:hypothetical protein [Pikeienuella sp. HZG-20]|uniref:hypothetical protein n=1 Tax=Paludibacillus litoralis TaxID=3133267 RepID=UPI0030EDF4E1
MDLRRVGIEVHEQRGLDPIRISDMLERQQLVQIDKLTTMRASEATRVAQRLDQRKHAATRCLASKSARGLGQGGAPLGEIDAHSAQIRVGRSHRGDGCGLQIGHEGKSFIFCRRRN